MKKIFLPLIVFLFLGCSEKPSDVAMEFTKNFSEGKIKEAKSLGTQTTASTIDLLVTLGYKKGAQKPNLELVSEEIDGDSAIVIINDKTTGKHEKFDLVKQDGKWKVDLRKQ